MPISVTAAHALSATTPDDPTYEIRPSHWNSAHNVTASLDIAATEISGLFSNANGLSFGLSNNSITGSYTVPTQTAYVFSEGNGVTFGTNGSTVTASVQTAYQSQGAYLTTARASNDAVGLNTAQTNVTWTVNSNGISLNAGAYLTTAMQSQSSSVFAKTGFTTATTAGSELVGTLDTNGLNLGVPKWLTAAAGAGDGFNVLAAGTETAGTATTVAFVNSNGLTFGMSGSSQITASHNGITTARASNDAIGLNTAATQVTWTVNSAGISLNAGAYLTTAMASNASTNFAGIGETTGTTNGTDLKMTVDTAGVNISFPKWITTAALSDHSHGNPTLNLTNLSGTTASNSAGFTLSLSAAAPGGGAAISAGANSQNTGTVNFANSNGITFGLSNNGTLTASHNGLTTAALSDHSHGNPTLALTNLSGTTASASNGFTLSLNQLDDHFSGWTLGGNTAGTTSTGLTTEGGLNLVGGNNITLSGNSNSITIVGPTPGGTTHYTCSEYDPFRGVAPVTNGSLGQSTLYFAPFDVGCNLSASRINFFMSIASTWSGANTRSCSMRLGYAIYTRSGNGSQATLSRLTSYECPFVIMSGNSSTQILLTMYNGLSNATSHSTLQSAISNVSVPTFISNSVAGFRVLALPVNLTLAPGRYWLGVSNQTASSNASAVLGMNVLQVQVSNQIAWRNFATSSAASNASFYAALPGFGTYSAQSAAWPNSIPISSDSIRNAPVGTMPYFNISGYGTSLGVL